MGKTSSCASTRFVLLPSWFIIRQFYGIPAALRAVVDVIVAHVEDTVESSTKEQFLPVVWISSGCDERLG